ncbi:MAG: hypothetical protein K9G62_08950 [Alphaproteobacteria bacterium]|nr:hypothetical protein [Alphaproteobacteria bacterium]
MKAGKLSRIFAILAKPFNRFSQAAVKPKKAVSFEVRLEDSDMQLSGSDTNSHYRAFQLSGFHGGVVAPQNEAQKTYNFILNNEDDLKAHVEKMVNLVFLNDIEKDIDISIPPDFIKAYTPFAVRYAKAACFLEGLHGYEVSETEVRTSQLMAFVSYLPHINEICSWQSVDGNSIDPFKVKNFLHNRWQNIIYNECQNLMDGTKVGKSVHSPPMNWC